MNKAMIIGNLGNDPELRHTQNGTPVVTFNVATTEKWKDAEGVLQNHTDWHRIVAWKGLAEVCNSHLKKAPKSILRARCRPENGMMKTG